MVLLGHSYFLKCSILSTYIKSFSIQKCNFSLTPIISLRVRSERPPPPELAPPLQQRLVQPRPSRLSHRHPIRQAGELLQVFQAAHDPGGQQGIRESVPDLPDEAEGAGVSVCYRVCVCANVRLYYNCPIFQCPCEPPPPQRLPNFPPHLREGHDAGGQKVRGDATGICPKAGDTSVHVIF